MARPAKSGIDYFSVDVDMDSDDKIVMIEAIHGMVGFGTVMKLLMTIYRNGYYYSWSEREQLIFSKKNTLDVATANAIVKDCVNWGLFEKERYEKYQILTSSGIQKRFVEAAKKRKYNEIIEEYWIGELPDIVKKVVNAGINPVNDGINPVNSDICTQSKVKEKETKVNKKNNKKETFDVIKTITNDPDFSPEKKEALTVFVEMRKGIKKPLTEYAYKLLINKLASLAMNENEQIEILNQSVMNSWQSLYPLKNNTRGAPPGEDIPLAIKSIMDARPAEKELFKCGV